MGCCTSRANVPETAAKLNSVKKKSCPGDQKEIDPVVLHSVFLQMLDAMEREGDQSQSNVDPESISIRRGVS